MRDFRNFGDRTAKAVHEAHMSQRNDQRILIYKRVVRFHSNPIVLRPNKGHFRSPGTLRQPDMAHRGKFKFAKHHLVPLLERQRACKSIDAS